MHHRLPVFDKHGEHLPVVSVLFTRLTFPFSMQLLLISSFRFLFLLKAVIGPSWNNPWTVLQMLSILQCFRTMLLMFGKKRL